MSVLSAPSGLTLRSAAVPGRRPAVIVLPGGGYAEYGVAGSERLADFFASIGVHALVYRYPIVPQDQASGPLHPAPILGLRHVFEWLRADAGSSLGVEIDVDRIGVVGSSAGGHLAACLANGIDDPHAARPAFCVLAYPVVSMEHPTRPRPARNLLGARPSWRLRRELSMELRVDERTPPTFLWTTADDDVVRATNTLAYADALVRQEIPVEVHVFPHGRHGLGVAVREPHTAQWTALCEHWLRYRRILAD